MDSPREKAGKTRLQAGWSRITDWLTVPRVGVLLLLLSVVVGIVGYANEHRGAFDFGTFITTFYANISSELASIAITVLIIDSLNRRREAKLTAIREFERLFPKMGSTNNPAAILAVEELRARGWLTDGSLQEKDFRSAKLDDAKLWEADLQGVNLQWAHLKNANLNRVNFVGANLTQAYLGGAKCNNADLRSANLFEAKLYGVGLFEADLRDANLRGAHLKDAKLTNAHFDEKTVLPDGSNWSPDTDMAMFTDPAHASFWAPPVKPKFNRTTNGTETTEGKAES